MLLGGVTPWPVPRSRGPNPARSSPPYHLPRLALVNEIRSTYAAPQEEIPVWQKPTLQVHGHVDGGEKPPAVVKMLMTVGVLVVVALAGGAFKHGTCLWLM